MYSSSAGKIHFHSRINITFLLTAPTVKLFLHVLFSLVNKLHKCQFKVFKTQRITYLQNNTDIILKKLYPYTAPELFSNN